MEVQIKDTSTLGLLIKASRMSQRMTRDEVALATGLSPAFISNVEAGKKTAQIGKVLTLLTELGITIACEAKGVEKIYEALCMNSNKRLRK